MRRGLTRLRRVQKAGKTVVMGGVHPTYCPDEALQHADAIVCGEAEDLWPRLVEDYEAGAMQRVYKMTAFPSLEHYRSPRVELLSPDSYMTRQCKVSRPEGATSIASFAASLRLTVRRPGAGRSMKW